ncbi:MAG: glycosyltransferase family 2 protein [Clostridia bacterium]|nr:glycosyltransferase family 2 protein [Clostridia bacterium]MBO5359168.1 glycosyltransferase family 2 protein [Clostridia bacterium]
MAVVSIIVPIYNSEKYLNRCIDSILSQTFKDFEVILVNDGSSDNSGKICDDYALNDNRVKVLHKQNGGVSAARNDGIRAASGEYIMFVDSDDYIDSGMLQFMLEKQAGDVELVICSTRIVGVQATQDFHLRDGEYYPCGLIEKFCLDNSFKISLSSPFAKLFRKCVLIENELVFDTNMSLGEDTDFNMRYVSKMHKKTVVMNEIYYSYVKDNEDSLFSKFRSHHYSNVTSVYDRIYEVASELGCSEAALLNLTEGHINRLITDVLKAFSTADKNVCIDYMKNVSNDKYFIENFEMLKKSKLRYITAKLLIKKQYKLIYYFMLIKYKLISV